jgi:predicted ATPase
MGVFGRDYREATMQDVFITKIHIDKVRHLENVDIVLSDKERRHLILTGKNGSGKTSLLEAMRDSVLSSQSKYYNNKSAEMQRLVWDYIDWQSMIDPDKQAATFGIEISYSTTGPEFSQTIFAYIPAARNQLDVPKNIEPMDIQGKTIITRNASREFLKYVLHLDYQLYGAQTDGNAALKANLEKWFDDFRNALRDIYNCPELLLQRDTKNLAFNILIPGREPFGLHEMSDGYAALIDIYMELLMRFEGSETVVEYETPAIVLIDELETHLHVELQKQALPFLTRMFPNVQFVVATHSPFVITSLENAVVFDLEKNERLENPGVYSYEAVVESFLDTDMYSEAIKKSLKRYKELYLKERTPEETKELAGIKAELELVPPASKELYMAFRALESERKANKNGAVI